MTKKRVSIKDIADLAGVTHPTVSRALRGEGRMSDETRARILAIAQEVGYTPSMIARGLVTRRRYTIGMVVSNLADPFRSETTQGAEDTARQHGYSIILAIAGVNPERELEVVRNFQSRQVDGIIVDKRASLATLLGTLAAFYKKMGFPKIRFRPSFFPYTEPSAEVYLWLEHRDEWVEMGGSGIFRPEVTLPLGCRDRVLAWGLGLERLAMMIHNLKSIGDLYFATMPWLREAPLCRS